ncbi:hypothetical protein [Sphingorhabdus sp. YGSMI21]|uniref:hypothetical protein n=1 Tax=Sphingorhabdus sp. YGSMI21 TaxID=2077182 RepID=UPI000F5098D8|nr:hypothetical protein [Sphingorhabdus sp. YGSMI21]
MSENPVMALDSFIPVPDISVLELAVVICCARRPGVDGARLAKTIGRWFGIKLVENDLKTSLRRLSHRDWLKSDGTGLHVGEEAREKAEFAAHGLVQLLFRDRYFFDVGKLLDVSIVKEDQSHED